MMKNKIIIFISLILTAARAYCDDNLKNVSLDEIVKEVKQKYGITMHYANLPPVKFPEFDYSLEPKPDMPALKNIILIFVKEISIYPKNFFRDADCRDIYFVTKLFYKNKPADGVFSKGAKFIFYDYSREINRSQKIRHYIHHELYHMIGSLHPFWNGYSQEWINLNRPGFIYNQKYNLKEKNPLNYFAPSEIGFITHYAMVSDEEDRAEIFAAMMIPEELKLLRQWAEKDDILFKKMNLMKKFLDTLSAFN